MYAIRTVLSVLALSSRFDGRRPSRGDMHHPALSVLALSSRFDGPIASPAELNI